MPTNPRLIPVLDVMGGQAVHAVGGRRTDYRPLASRLVSSTDPVTVAVAMLKASGAGEIYVADIDAIQGKTPSAPIDSLLEAVGVPIWLDGGFGTDLPLPDLRAMPLLRLVVGFETCRTPRAFLHCLEAAAPEKICFSIDLRDGELAGDWGAWGLRNPRDSLGLARAVVAMGCRDLIVLDLARVGLGGGCGTDELLRSIRTECPVLDLIAGGGIKAASDIEHLGDIGVNAVLLASAIHNRSLPDGPVTG